MIWASWRLSINEMMGMAPLTSCMQLTSKHTPPSDKKRIETTEALALGQNGNQGIIKAKRNLSRSEAIAHYAKGLNVLNLLYFIFFLFLSLSHSASFSISLLVVLLPCSKEFRNNISVNARRIHASADPGQGGGLGVQWEYEHAERGSKEKKHLIIQTKKTRQGFFVDGRIERSE